jgi:hypothetical protein
LSAEQRFRADPTDRIAFGEFCRQLVEGGRLDRVREITKTADFKMFDAMRPMRMHDLTELERTTFAEICLESCQCPEATTQLSRAVAYLIEHDIKGALVECGVYQGASAIVIIRTLQSLGITDRELWLYDTFEGMPKPEEIDRFYCEEEGDQLRFWDKTKRAGGGSDWVRAELPDVQRYVGRCDYPPSRIRYIKGLVEDTIPATAPDQIALLRLDTDFYASTKHELVQLYPRVVSGGVVIIDDYGAYRGAQQATDEFFKENGLRVLLSRIDEHVRMFVKP